MRVLVTGATGLIGAHTAAALDRAGHGLRLLVRDPAKANACLAPFGLTDLDLAVGDVTDGESVGRALVDCDAVFHAAGLVSLEARRAEETRRTNVDGTRNVVGRAADRGIDRIVYVSSVSVFASAPVITPATPLGVPAGPYGQSKHEAEAYVRSLQDAGAPVASTYPTGVIAPDAPEVNASMMALVMWVKSLIPRMAGGAALVDARDLALMHVAALERAELPARFLAGGHFLPWVQLADEIDAVTGARVRRVPNSQRMLRAIGRAGDALRRVVPLHDALTYEAMKSATDGAPVDSGAALSALGVSWRPIGETLTDTIRWLAAHGDLPPQSAGRLAL